MVDWMSLPQILRMSMARLVSRVGGAVLIGLVAIGLFDQATQSPAQTPGREQLPENLPETTTEYLERSREVTEAFNLGLSEGLATVASVVSLIAALLLCIVAMRAFGRERFGADRPLSDGLGWAIIGLGLAVLGGLVLFTVSFLVVGLFLAVLGFIAGPLVLLAFPLLLLGLLVFAGAVFYVVPAIAIDGRGVIASFQDSFGLFRKNALTTMGLVLFLGIVSLGVTAATAVLFFTAPPAVTVGISSLLSAVFQVFLYAALAAAYVVIGEDSSTDSVQQTVTDQSADATQPGDAWTDD